ncbi:MAG TPA: glycosyl hydrolase family 65 protein [Chloroflexota bacterium]|nr:glycosyl hydrolase family 65 protein [Chloroflexota bacterium]
MTEFTRDEWRSPDPDPFWRLGGSHREPWLRAYLGNGLLTTQVVAEGGLAGQTGRQPLRLLAGLYDQAPDREVEHPAPVPGWRGLQLMVGPHALVPDEAGEYRQEMLLFHGVVETTHGWALPEGTITAVTAQAVPRQEERLILTRLTLTADMPCTVTVTAEPDREAHPAPRVLSSGVSGAHAWIRAQTHERRIEVVAAATLLDEDGPGNGEIVGATLTLHLAPQQSHTITWLTATHDGRSAPDPLDAALADLVRAAAIGPARLLAEHALTWHELWRQDIQIEGDPEVQRFTRAGMFALLCSLRAGVPTSIAPMGLSSMAYNGHIFWDADTWMFPPILLTFPGLAREMVSYRQDRLAPALTRAHAEGYAGAMFPWESATDGTEVTPSSIARTGLKEHHITACVALAQWQYYLATGDRAWLGDRAWPVLAGAAEYWVSRVIHTERGYEIHDVIAADEYAEDVDNDAFTNAAARAALLAAVEAARLLDRPVPDAWREIADHLMLARDGELVLEFDHYDGRVIKQADVELLTFPLEYPLSQASIARNLDTYRKATDPDGPAMSRCISAIVAAQLGRREMARTLFAGCYEPNLWGPFYSLAETRTNAEVNFLTGVGGALQSLLFGFAGLRLHDSTVALDPLLPAGWQALRFSRLWWRGAPFALHILPGDRAEYVAVEADVPFALSLHRWRPGAEPLTVEVWVEPDASCELAVPGWRVEWVESDKHRWHVWPPTAEPTDPFVLLRLMMRTDDGRAYDLEIEQRVRDGDDRIEAKEGDDDRLDAETSGAEP